MTMTAPGGFGVSVPSTVTVASASSQYVWAHITSPSDALDGDYPLGVTIDRQGVASQAANSL